jgi:hypothetical protein
VLPGGAPKGSCHTRAHPRSHNTSMSPRRLVPQAEPAHTLAGMVGPEASIDDHVRATLCQIDHLDLWKGARPALSGVPPKHGSLGRGIRYVFHRAIQRHEAQAEEKRSAGRLGRNRLADLMEQQGQGDVPPLDSGALVSALSVGKAIRGSDQSKRNPRASLLSTAPIDRVV